MILSSVAVVFFYLYYDFTCQKTNRNQHSCKNKLEYDFFHYFGQNIHSNTMDLDHHSSYYMWQLFNKYLKHLFYHFYQLFYHKSFFECNFFYCWNVKLIGCVHSYFSTNNSCSISNCQKSHATKFFLFTFFNLIYFLKCWIKSIK